MNFKVLGVVFLTIIFVANAETIGEVKISCQKKCRTSCIFDLCYRHCMKHCLPPVSTKELNCQLACSTHRCSKCKKGIILS